MKIDCRHHACNVVGFCDVFDVVCTACGHEEGFGAVAEMM